MNRAFSEAGRPRRQDGTDRLGPAYVRNLQGVIDRPRADHPTLRIESSSRGDGLAEPADRAHGATAVPLPRRHGRSAGHRRRSHAMAGGRTAGDGRVGGRLQQRAPSRAARQAGPPVASLRRHTLGGAVLRVGTPRRPCCSRGCAPPVTEALNCPSTQGY
ncbi:hypothetical protein [Streptomyces sp. NBC_01003]|uniref:hypothetical protein n=1 Tax=Streptomyces sp. NBC_01003 TaxID=2903714 RepID=UPI00386409DE